MLVKLAWRNLWRQKRRTLLTALALSLALCLSLFMRSMQEGTYANNIDNSARFSTGLIQLQHPEFAESQSIEDLLPQTEAFIAPARRHPDIEILLPRIETFSLAAFNDRSKGVMVQGVDPELEQTYSKIAERITDGEFLSSDDQGVLIGAGLARYFSIEVGDELVLYGQGYRGQIAAGLYRVKGILTLTIAELNNQLVYMPLSLAQTLFSTEAQVTAWVLHTRTIADIPHTLVDLRERYQQAEQAVNVRDWQDIAPEMAQQIAMDKAGGIFMMYLLYGVVGFGLFATILMMTLERQREFSVMLATGLLRRKLVTMVIIESGFITLLGIIIGLIIVTPLLVWFYYHPIQLTGETAQMIMDMGWEPIMPMLLTPGIFMEQIIVITALMGLCLIYPLWRIYRLDLVSALKGGS